MRSNLTLPTHRLGSSGTLRIKSRSTFGVSNCDSCGILPLSLPKKPATVFTVRRVLELGPKFAVDTKRTNAELLSVVRRVSKRVPEDEAPRLNSEGVDVLLRSKPRSDGIPLYK
ncbi:hypothetical protein HPB52_006497 [Rhipicephalus sanguineus]|uniref:Uncharacterized protein n=1 Tax=Rhipicephalus sanguineus TaxID=34632 RepID=A0A9D4T8Q2_RHISA|nr:hypothetical protein HPB52_006497 [Rhipicephalus sanguineus]